MLLTTRAKAAGEIAEPIEIERMSLEEGTLFLSRRATKILKDGSMKDASLVDQKNAREIVRQVGGLPLALNETGAYIEETGEELGHYLQLYQSQPSKLLPERGELSTSHPESVTGTFLLAFRRVEQASPVAANIMRLCAFFAPDAIPESLLTDIPALIVGTSPCGPQPQERKASRNWPRFFRQSHDKQSDKPPAPSPTKIRSMLNAASRALLRFSLIRRDDRTFTLVVHRLVQAVLRDSMDESMQRQWAERAVRIVNAAFPTAEFIGGM